MTILTDDRVQHFADAYRDDTIPGLLARDLLDARAELERVRETLEDQADFLDQMHHARMTGLGRDPDKYASELSGQRDKIRAALTTQEPKP
jgi:hypothetical protein